MKLALLGICFGLVTHPAFAFDYPESTSVRELENGYLEVVVPRDFSREKKDTGITLNKNCDVSFQAQSYRVWHKVLPLAASEVWPIGVFSIRGAVQTPSSSSGPKTVMLLLNDGSQIRCRDSSPNKVLHAQDVQKLLGSDMKIQTPLTYPISMLTDNLAHTTVKWIYTDGEDDLNHAKQQSDNALKAVRQGAEEMKEIAPALSPGSMIHKEAEVLPGN